MLLMESGLRSLKTRVTLFTLGIFLVCIWSLAWFAGHALRGEMEQQIGVQEYSTAAFIARAIDRELEDRLEALHKVAGLIRERGASEPQTIQALLDERLILKGPFNGGTMFVSSAGTVLAEVPESMGRIGLNLGDRPYLEIALRDGRPAIGSPVIGRKQQAPVFGMAVPVRDAHERIIGALVGVTNLDQSNFLDPITQKTYGKTGSYLLVAPSQRLVVTASDKRRIMEVLPPAGANPELDRFIDGYEGSGRLVNPLGVDVLVAAKRLVQTDWYVAVTLPVDEAFEPMQASLQPILLAALALSILAAGLTWWMLRRQLSPMLDAARTLAAVADDGQPLQVLPVSQGDEIGQLIGAFNRLIETALEREAALRKSEELFSQFMLHSPVYIYIKEMTQTDCRVVQASANFREMIGVTGEAMRGKLMSELFPPEFARKMIADDHAIAASGKPIRLDEELDGRYYTTIKFPIVQGDRTLVAGYTMDITERRQVECELETYRHHLEKLVEERTAALSVAKEVAEAANRAKSTFLATMSHELRTPLNGIMGMVDLARRSATDPRQIEQLAKAQQASRSLLAIINDILDISKIEAERLKLENIEFRLGGVLNNLSSLLASRVADKGLQFALDLSPELAAQPVRGDPLRLSQILINLAGNAIKFTEHGTITVSARLEEEREQNLCIHFAVRDTGIGIARDLLPRLFSAFEQADGSMTRKYGGTGLGLAISKRLVTMMGGRIGVESEPGVGSTFWFTVVLGKATSAGEIAALPVGDAEQLLRERHAGRRVLLVEDEPVNQEVARDLMAEIGLQVETADDGMAALEMLDRGIYDLILMDIQMPRMNGIEATRAIRARPDGGSVPILAMTANAFEDDRRQCMACGMNDFVAKPVDPTVLFSRLLKWLDAFPRTAHGSKQHNQT